MCVVAKPSRCSSQANRSQQLQFIPSYSRLVYDKSSEISPSTHIYQVVEHSTFYIDLQEKSILDVLFCLCNKTLPLRLTPRARFRIHPMLERKTDAEKNVENNGLLSISPFTRSPFLWGWGGGGSDVVSVLFGRITTHEHRHRSLDVRYTCRYKAFDYYHHLYSVKYRVCGARVQGRSEWLKKKKNPC